MLSDNDIRRIQRTHASSGEYWVGPFARDVSGQVQAWARRLGRPVKPLTWSDVEALALYQAHEAFVPNPSALSFARMLEALMQTSATPRQSESTSQSA